MGPDGGGYKYNYSVKFTHVWPAHNKTGLEGCVFNAKNQEGWIILFYSLTKKGGLFNGEEIHVNRNLMFF